MDISFCNEVGLLSSAVLLLWHLSRPLSVTAYLADNVSVFSAAEAAVRASGGIPATIAVMGGVAKIGLEAAEARHLATAKSVLKLSRCNLPLALAPMLMLQNLVPQQCRQL